MAHDRADWHYGGNFPKDLPRENGGTHIGMFLAWAIMNGLENEEHRADFADEVDAVRSRRLTGREFLFKVCDEKFWTADLSDEGNAFASTYYTTDDPSDAPSYIVDYTNALAANLPSTYHVADTWENYDVIAGVLDERYVSWKATRRGA